MFGLARKHADQRFLFAYRAHRLKRSFEDNLPPNVRRTWLRDGGIFPHRCRLFHGLNQRLDADFPRSVATFHDLFVITGDYSTNDFRERFAAQARNAAARADRIIAVSQFTADQIVDLLGVDRSIVRVVHHGVRPPITAPIPDSARRNVILHVGAIQKRKNLSRLVEAFEQTSKAWELVLAGSFGYGSEAILARIEASPRRADIRLPGYVDDAALESLYAEARVFAFPSLDEGFGMPVLDAMARGIPVLTSRGSALEEVAAGAAWFVEPKHVESIAEGLKQLTTNYHVRAHYRHKGLERVTAFSWEKAVDETWQVYLELM